MVFGMRNRGPVLRWGTSVAASALFATLLVAVGITVRDGAPVSPSAGVTDLCSGWSGCNSADYSDAGYGAVSGRMYWNMYSGHNCTNYVAYRMIKAGMSATRPWVGGGNASEWGLHMRDITDQVPSVGSVAWWGRYDNGSGSAGHVGYVEKVVSSSEIIISMDSWGGTFHWRRITKDSGRWPTGFIHFVDKKLTPTVTPKVTGTPKVGEALRLDPGTWTPSAKRTMQWLADGVAIPGQTGGGLQLTPALVGKNISVRVKATRSGYDPVTVTTKATADVAPGTFETGEQPVISGEAYVDGVLTATAGGWDPDDPAIEWRWYADGVRIRGNGGSTLALKPEHDGAMIKVVAVARKDGYTTATAPAVAQVGPVLAGKITVAKPLAITGTNRVGYQLNAVPGTYEPADVTAAYQWLRDGVPIPGATRSRYVQTVADVGATISVRATLTRPRYVPLAVDAVTARTQAVPTLKVATSGGRGKANVAVRVTVPGVTPVAGWVEVTIGRHVRKAQLVDGLVRVTIDDLAVGSKNVKVYFRGSSSVVAKRATATVVVK